MGLKSSPRVISMEILQYRHLVSFAGKMWNSQPWENATTLTFFFGIFTLESFHHQCTFWSLPFPSIPADVPTVYTHALEACHLKAGIFLNIFRGKIWSFLSSHQRKKHAYDFQAKSLLLGITQNTTIKATFNSNLTWRWVSWSAKNGAMGHHPISRCFFRWFLSSLSGC